ncbi:hypothetical protein DLAC_04853 [Tieghemostelium lacteum]|uniref:Pesticidal crystal protein domain-containing protein n=1 Tax=Tieghemostelium lacteum TaxID=361077 RepID=A0A151ZIZ3_TIELA|nr:hypothetical protein DLAC_04853 [Tieghemostelium lacteum]|eukprot:KYQ93962.1 hypothetical protein DLAC_04853 [Tieghemostelium lacteum]
MTTEKTVFSSKADWLLENSNRAQRIFSNYDGNDLSSEEINYFSDTCKTLAVSLVSILEPAGAFLGPVVDVVWTAVMEAQAVQEELEEKKSFIQAIIDIVDDKVNIYDNSTLQAVFKACQISVHNLSTDLKILANKKKENPPISDTVLQVYQENVRTSFQIAMLKIEESTYLSSKEGHEIEELPMYALFAFGHLSLLRDVSIHGLSWGLPQETIDIKYKNRFPKFLKSYTDHCVKWYHAGSEKIGALSYMSDALKHNKINQFRNIMITQVFDLLHVLSYMDPVEHPIAVISDRVRFLYSDLNGHPINPNVRDTSSEAYFTTPLDVIDKIIYDNNSDQYRNSVLKKVVLSKSSGMPNYFTSVQNYVVNGQGVESIIYTKGQVNETQQAFNFEGTIQGMDSNSFIYPATIKFDKAGSWSCDQPLAVGNHDAPWFLEGHKISLLFSLGVNKNSSVNNGAGVLDSLVAQFEPVENFPQNVVYKQKMTAIDAQKFSEKDWVQGNLVHSFVFPGFHAVSVVPTKTLTYTLQFEGKKNFIVGLRVGYNSPKSMYTVKLFDDKDTLLDTLKIADQKSSDKLKNYWFDTARLNSKNSKLKFKLAKESIGNLTIVAILFKPANAN